MPRVRYKTIKRLLMTFAVCLAGLSLSNVTTSARSGNGLEDILFKKIIVADDKNDLKSVKDDIKRVLKLNPKHQGAIFYAGKYSYVTGNEEGAKRFLQRIVNDKDYGAKASAILADMRLDDKKAKHIESIKILIVGESYDAALKMCEDYLSAIPDNAEIVLKSALVATVLNNRDKAEAASAKFRQLKSADKRNYDINALIDGWFMDEADAGAAIDKLLSIEDRDMLIPPIKNKIRSLIVETGEIEKFEFFINRECRVPGADVGTLERELISFFLKHNKPEKALEVLERRPVDSLDDNLLYVKILAETAKEEKAIENAGYLINANPNDLRCYKAWVDAWISFVDRKQAKPGGEEAKKYLDRAESILMYLKPESLIESEPKLLLNLFRMAVLTQNNKYALETHKHVLKIAFTEEFAQSVINAADELISFYQRDAAMDLLQAAWKDLPSNYNIPLKMAEITMDTDPETASKILDIILTERPEHVRAFLMWTDCMSRMGKPDLAAGKLIDKLKDPTLDNMIKRQLQAKLELLSIQGVDISSYGYEMQPIYEEPEQGEQESFEIIE